jgi:tripartite-type tricarboxylate transporter receptor subunit TctC
MLTRRRLAAAMAATPAAPALTRAQGAGWPTDRPIEVIVPYPPGGGVDVMTRMAVLTAAQHSPRRPLRCGESRRCRWPAWF